MFDITDAMHPSPNNSSDEKHINNGLTNANTNALWKNIDHNRQRPRIRRKKRGVNAQEVRHASFFSDSDSDRHNENIKPNTTRKYRKRKITPRQKSTLLRISDCRC